MKVLYLDCGMGAAGDMLMGALLSLLGEEEQRTFVQELNQAGIPHVHVEAHKDKKCGIEGTHVRVLIDGREEGSSHEHHVQNHHHHASMEEIVEIIRGLKVSAKVKQEAEAVYRRIAEAESSVHGTAVSEIHFHEVGMMDAITDIVGCAMLLERLAVQKIVVSPINTGFGKVSCAHGILPVPAPATALLLKGIPCYAGKIEGELCTPTGAALLGCYASEFSNMPVMAIEEIGYGTGQKDFPAANVLRAVLGRMQEQEEEIIELRCNMDDITAEELGYVTQLLMEQGAKDVFTTAVTMKKGRPGVLLTVLCMESDKRKIAELIFKHTPTIGIREVSMKRMVLNREWKTVRTPLGDIRVKISDGYGVHKCKAEYDDLKKIADEKQVSFQEIREQLKEMDK